MARPRRDGGKNDLLDGTLGVAANHQPLMTCVAHGVAVVPEEAYLVAESDIAVRLHAPLVATPVGGDVLARQRWTKLIETTHVAFDLRVGFGRPESLATCARPLRNVDGQVVGVAGEVRRSVSVAFDCVELAVEIIVLLLCVRPRVEPSRVPVGLFDVHSGLLADVDIRRIATAVVRLSPAFVGIASEVDESLQK